MPKKPFGFPAAFLLAVLAGTVFTSCTDFFTNSLGSWAARDRSKMTITVTADNIDSLMKKAENDPELMMAILRNMKSAIDKASGADKIKLQIAAMNISVGASGIMGAVLTNLGNVEALGDKDVDGLIDLFMDVFEDMPNLGPSSFYLMDCIDPASPQFDALVTSSNTGDLVLAAAILLLAEAKANSDPEVFLENFDGNNPSLSGRTKLAVDLALAAKDKIDSGAAAPGFYNNILDMLKLNP